MSSMCIVLLPGYNFNLSISDIINIYGTNVVKKLYMGTYFDK